MKYEIKKALRIKDKFRYIHFCVAAKFLLENREYSKELTKEELNGYMAVMRRDGLSASPNRISYKLNGGGWQTAYVDETLTQFFINTILPLWEKQKLR